ncbi:MAG: phytanoyl-CoA dioxygenase family protein [Gammaproteobacteria bacterium PRO9]|nr:phytanoyl-CoA dioxygenase family protein [Gammaproteobacteria bacterium PRO9]
MESFRQDGYVIVPGLVDTRAMTSIRHWTDEVQAWPETAGKWMKYFEEDAAGRRILNRIEDVLPFHEGFRELAGSALLAGACGQLFGEPAALFKDKINFKQPGGGGFEPHQDVQAGWSRYATMHITALVTIDPSTRANGYLEVAANFRGQRLIGTEWEPLTDVQLAGIEWRPIEAVPGDAVFFDSYVPHRSGPNTTGSQRRVLYYTYNKASEGDHLRQYYADKRQSYPPDIEREAGREYRYRV